VTVAALEIDPGELRGFPAGLRILSQEGGDSMSQTIEVMDLRSGERVRAVPATFSTGAFSAAPGYMLFSTQTVVIATLFGTPVAGATLMAVNYRRMGKPGLAAVTVALGLIVTAIAVAIGYSIPRVGFSPIALGLLILTRIVAASVQGKAVARHGREGGRLASGWIGFGVGVAYLAVILMAVLAAVSLGSAQHRAMMGAGDEVFYTR
jgi:hypothetical protein